MVCDCERCVLHFRTLGLEDGPNSSEAIKEAYRDAVKVWHPDRFENDPRLRLKAEEHFKRVQVAYRELVEHESDAKNDTSAPSEKPGPKDETVQAIPFGPFPGCYSAPNIPTEVERRVREKIGLRRSETVLGIVDLSGDNSETGDFSDLLLLSDSGVWVDSTFKRNSFLSYEDVGRLSLVDLRKGGKLGWWKGLVESESGNDQKFELEIYRLNGACFDTITAPADDAVKMVIYNFLLQKTDKE